MTSEGLELMRVLDELGADRYIDRAELFNKLAALPETHAAYNVINAMPSLLEEMEKKGEANG